MAGATQHCTGQWQGAPSPRLLLPPNRRARRSKGVPALVSALLPLSAGAAVSATTAAAAASLHPLPPPPPPPLAAVVPAFPRIGGQAVRDWIGQTVEQLPGFSGDDLARLLFPDLVGLVDGPTLLISGILLVAFVYWEGGILLRQLRERRRRQERERERQQRAAARGRMTMSAEEEEVAAAEAEAEAAAQREEEEARRRQQAAMRPASPLDRARYERRRGLGLLALVTAGMIWLTGVVNGPSPFQP